ncbi:hypothetical protein [Bordetella bronchiseptica]|uniref:hypothetical protein n=1 Tax=Bordetella bronchiseptica TaxID=518 RepID=UPI000460D609|nr:hypothetical protein [Bordetella bronchiseptica]KDD18601.1 hypothetical protein L522_4183 [Bordetella bronchiseptica MBORD707]
MSLTKFIAGVSRAIHQSSIRLHCKCLGMTVRAADRNAVRQDDLYRSAQDVTNAARAAEQAQKGVAYAANTRATLVSLAAKEEARRIGGAL